MRSTDPEDPAVVGATVVDCDASEADPHRGFRFHSGETRDSVLAGLTIKNGYGPMEIVIDWSESIGGGIVCIASSPTIERCVVSSNTAGFVGGGIYCGGIWAGPSCDPAIVNNTIAHNNAEGGGGIYYEFCCPRIVSNTITGNVAMPGGGIFCYESSGAMITDNMIAGNSDAGIWCGSGESPTIMNNTIVHNGTGIWCEGGGSSPVIINNMIICSGTGIYCCQSASTTIVNNTIAYNSKGICLEGSSPSQVINTIIAFNSFGIDDSDTPVSLRCNCVYGNSDSDYSGLVDFTGTDGNISADPGFVRAPVRARTASGVQPMMT